MKTIHFWLYEHSSSSYFLSLSIPRNTGITHELGHMPPTCFPPQTPNSAPHWPVTLPTHSSSTFTSTQTHPLPHSIIFLICRNASSLERLTLPLPPLGWLWDELCSPTQALQQQLTTTRWDSWFSGPTFSLLGNPSKYTWKPHKDA